MNGTTEDAWAPSSTLSAPPPWTLEGRAIVAPARSRGGGNGLLVFARYTASPVGPYDEVLWVPHLTPPLTIATIRVSSPDSVAWGRRNWGIPKELGAFTWDECGSRWHVTAAAAGSDTPFAVLTVDARGPRLPLPGSLLPPGLRRLEQHLEGRRYRFAPQGTAHGRAAKVSAACTGGDGFPALRVAPFALQFDSFRLTLPIPETRPG